MLEEFWETYTEGDPDDALAQELRTLLDDEEWAAAHEIYEEKGTEAARDWFDQWPRKQSEEYYPGVFDAELEIPPDPKRIKAEGGRVEYGGGGRIAKALTGMQKKILADISAYTEKTFKDIETLADPTNENYTAVKVVDEDGNEYQFLHNAYAEDAMDAIEEVEYGEWPPKKGPPNPFGNFAVGGKVSKALTALRRARRQLTEGSDPEIESIAREVEQIPGAESLGKRMRLLERVGRKNRYTPLEMDHLWERVMTQFDETLDKVDPEGQAKMREGVGALMEGKPDLPTWSGDLDEGAKRWISAEAESLGLSVDEFLEEAWKLRSRRKPGPIQGI